MVIWCSSSVSVGKPAIKIKGLWGLFSVGFLRTLVIVPEIAFSNLQVESFYCLQVFVEVKDTPLEDWSYYASPQFSYDNPLTSLTPNLDWEIRTSYNRGLFSRINWTKASFPRKAFIFELSKGKLQKFRFQWSRIAQNRILRRCPYHHLSALIFLW